MKTPYGMPIIGDCLNCQNIPKDRFCDLALEGGFCDLPESSLQAWSNVRHNSVYPPGAVLFVEGQVALGAFFVCMGRVKLSATAPDGTTIIFKICNAGEFAGLSAAFQGRVYEATAQTLEPCVVNNIKNTDLDRLVRTDGEIARRIVGYLSFEVQAGRYHIRDLRFRDRAIERLACFLAASAGPEDRLSMRLTHGEIGEILGLARETVTRTIRELKDRQIVRVSGHLISIIDRDGLLTLANDNRCQAAG